MVYLFCSKSHDCFLVYMSVKLKDFEKNDKKAKFRVTKAMLKRLK